MGKSCNVQFLWTNIVVFTRNDQKAWSNRNSIVGLPVAKPYFFDICLKKKRKAVATLKAVMTKKHGQGRLTKNTSEHI